MNNLEQSNTLNANPTAIDETKMKRILKKIVELENENVKTREYNDESMKKKIEKIIEEEVKCC